MITRILSLLITAKCIVAFILIVCLLTGVSFVLRSLKSSKDPNAEKWATLDSKVHHIETKLEKHHEMIGEMKSIVNQISTKSNEFNPPQKRSINKVVSENGSEFNSTALHTRFNISSCPMQMHTIPKTDIQMLSVYDKLAFDDNMTKEKQDWNIEYKEDQWSQKNKLKVFIVPFSHNDPGWLMTFEKYYYKQTHAIFSNMVKKLTEGSGRKFIWTEISFLAMWWDCDATNYEKALFINLLKNKTIEIVTGGWVMNDEANSHWLSTIQQLTTGHQWCMDNLGFAPKNSWSIDPFGHSSSQPYLLKLAGFENSVIQRVHYRLKKQLASNKQLEFKWRQLWDGAGKTDMFTHLLPFVSYGVSYSCGPDVEICCQFDFKALPHNITSLECPKGPQNIIQKNLQERASLILDQWRKKAQLYRSNVLLFPLGDDFMYDRTNEWDNQFQNYDMLIDYINNNYSLNTEVKFGNLEDYFKALHEEVKMTDFPVLSGDFFTYADRRQYYWSGYFTSRPFYKHMDRVLLAYLRGAETISSQAMASRTISNTYLLQLRNRVEQARRSLALFQHHDAITGTSRDIVVEDYAKKMQMAIKYCQSAIRQAASFLLKQPSTVGQSWHIIYFDENWRRHDELPSRITISLDVDTPSRKILLYNTLVFTRHEILTVYVSSPYIEVFDPAGNPIMVQISPALVGDKRLTFADSKYQLSFPVVVKSLALITYTVSLSNNTNTKKYTSYCNVRVYIANHWTVDLPKMFKLEQSSARIMQDITIQTSNGTKIIVGMNGLIKAVVSSDGTVVPVNMDFVRYNSQLGTGNNSGAYLFMPSGLAQSFHPAAFREIIVTEGLYKTTLYTVLTSEEADVVLAISIYNNPSLQQSEVEISSTLLINPLAGDLELAMRFSTDIKNGDVFYTDVNGMHMIKRRYFKKLPIQGNYYPLPSAAYIEDDNVRLTLLTSTPLGIGALESGQIEVMQDRRLLNDDSRGLGQGVMDNVRTRHVFKLIIENANKPCPVKAPVEHPSGQLTLGAHVAQQYLLQPLIVMGYTGREDVLRHEYSHVTLNAADLVLAAYQSFVTAKNKEDTVLRGMGVTFQRVYLEPCYGNEEINKWYQLSDGQVHISELVEAPAGSLYESTLTFITLKNQLPDGVITLCPQEVRSVFINETY